MTYPARPSTNPQPTRPPPTAQGRTANPGFAQALAHYRTIPMLVIAAWASLFLWGGVGCGDGFSRPCSPLRVGKNRPEDMPRGQSQELDSSLRYALRTKKEISEIMDMEKVQQYICRVDEALEQEQDRAKTELDRSRAGGSRDDVKETKGEAEGEEPSDKELAEAVGQDAVKVMSDEVKDEIAKYKKEAARIVSALRFLTEPKTAVAMTNELKVDRLRLMALEEGPGEALERGPGRGDLLARARTLSARGRQSSGPGQ